jgi:hypothetical protein
MNFSCFFFNISIILMRRTPFSYVISTLSTLQKLHTNTLPFELRKASLVYCQGTKALFVCWKVVSFWKVNSGKVNSRKMNYFSMFGSVMENKLENTFQYLVMSWKMSWKITY